jgi:hypothetical protein
MQIACRPHFHGIMDLVLGPKRGAAYVAQTADGDGKIDFNCEDDG